MSSSSAKHSRRRAMLTATACAGLLLLFVLLSYSAARSKSPTVDEPLHLVGGFMHRAAGDFRMDPENPPLFGYLATLSLGSTAMQPDYQLRNWTAMLDDHNLHQYDFAADVLRQTPGIDPDALFQRSRFIFVLVGVALGAIIATWSRQMGGAASCIIATALFALDPNFLGHAPLVKNDVLFSLAIASLVWCTWQFGRRGTIRALVGLAAACAVAINVKFSGGIAALLILLLLIIRVLLPHPWVVINLNLDTRLKRLIVVSAVCGIVGVVSYLSIWACYQWRFLPTQDPHALLNTPLVMSRIKASRAGQRLGEERLTPQLVESEPAGFVPDLIVWTESHHLLPQAFCFGFLYIYNATLHFLPSYLMGRYSETGWWYYFPCAMLFKTPTATLLAAILAVAAVISPRIARRRSDESARTGTDWWSILCLAVPIILYGSISLSTRINVGLRHMLPIYPFIFVAVGVAFGEFIRRYRRQGIIGASILLLGLSIETLAAYPDYIAFFNAPSGGSRGGIKLLADSNLDWGQDLKLLARWQQAHADKPLYLAYFGSIDPASYGIRARYLPGGWPYTSRTPLRSSATGYVAISATHLLGIHYKPESRQTYAALRGFKPITVLGGSIYVYELPLRPENRE